MFGGILSGLGKLFGNSSEKPSSSSAETKEQDEQEIILPKAFLEVLDEASRQPWGHRRAQGERIISLLGNAAVGFDKRMAFASLVLGKRLFSNTALHLLWSKAPRESLLPFWTVFKESAAALQMPAQSRNQTIYRINRLAQSLAIQPEAFANLCGVCGEGDTKRILVFSGVMPNLGWIVKATHKNGTIYYTDGFLHGTAKEYKKRLERREGSRPGSREQEHFKKFIAAVHAKVGLYKKFPASLTEAAFAQTHRNHPFRVAGLHEGNGLN